MVLEPPSTSPRYASDPEVDGTRTTSNKNFSITSKFLITYLFAKSLIARKGTNISNLFCFLAMPEITRQKLNTLKLEEEL